MKKIALHWQIFIGLLLGISFGYFFPHETKYISWMGTIFLRALQMVIIPLLLVSITSGILNIGGMSGLGRMGLKTLGYYIMTSLLAIYTGLLMVNLFQPGIGADLGFSHKVEGLEQTGTGLGETLINMIPKNIFHAMAEGEMLSIIFFSMLVGIFALQLPEKYRKVIEQGSEAGFQLMMKITNFVIRFTPLGIFGIMAGVVASNVGEEGQLAGVFSRLGLYMITVLSALFIHAVVILPALLYFIGKVNPLKHFKALSEPLLTAFSTCSSSATLPLTLQAVENKAGVSRKVSSFVLPLGATVNMDGTALYECVAAIFIAQAYGIDLSVWQQVTVVFTALLASIGAAAVPMAGLVMITIVLSAVGLPLEGVGLIVAVDRILDMFRTSVNVWSDASGAGIIARTEGEVIKTAVG